MTFIHGYLLAGLVLVGVPILVHLILRQKPIPLPFPAFRFLKQKHQTNRRKLLLQHWLLLALRMLLIAVLVLALSRPRLAGEMFSRSFRSWLGGGADRAVAAVLVFDTSWSMDYREKAQSRLDQARQLALELHRDMAEGSRVLILDTGDDGTDEDWMTNPSQVRARLSGLRLRPVFAPLTRQIDRARRLLDQEGKEENAPLPLLYIFSDRTRTSWDGEGLKDFHRDEDSTNPLTVVYVDLGAEGPEDISIDSIKVDPTVVAPKGKVQVSVTVRATGTSYKEYLSCQLDSNPVPITRPLQLTPGQSQQKTFTLDAPSPPAGQTNAPFQTFAQVTVRLMTKDNRPFADALAFNNAAHATFVIRDDTRRVGRKMLTLVDSADPLIWEAAFKVRLKSKPAEAFECDVLTPEKADKLTVKDLERYRVVCLFETTNPSPALWDNLKAYVQGGGGLIIIPAGEELEKADLLKGFNDAAAARKLLPARLEKIVTVPENRAGVIWKGADTQFDGNHPLLLPFREWSRSADPDFARPGLRPFVNRYWKVLPLEKEGIIVSYADKDQSPALVEKSLDRGRVVLFTVVLDGRRFDNDKRDWHNYWKDSSFGLVLVNQVAGYLAGDISTQELNFPCGQLVTVPLPPETAPRAVFRLDGPDPDLADSERTIQAPKDLGEPPSLVLPQAVAPGNFRLLDRLDQRAAAFSLNVRPEESQLNRIDASDIEAVLGKGSVVRADGEVKLDEALQAHRPSPIELLPLLMVLMLTVLTFEGVLANRFYRREHPV
jgi:hypothetical protein